jgi:phage shock protein A
MIEGVMGLLFFLFWLWVIIAGFKSVGRRLFDVFLSRSGNVWSGWSRGEVWSASHTSYERQVASPPQSLTLVEAPADMWSREERRSFGRKLAAAPAVSTDAVVGEMQRELAKLIRNAAEVERNLTKWQAELHRIEAAQADWQDRAGLAVDKGRDQLARAALEQKAKLQPRADGLRADIARLEELLAGYRRDINVLEAKLSESIRRQVLAQSRLEGAEDSVRARELVFGQRTAAAFSNLEQVERAADLAEGKAEALTIGAEPGLAGEFAALESEARLERELEALKRARRPAA